jgi:hypothetical protein
MTDKIIFSSFPPAGSNEDFETEPGMVVLVESDEKGTAELETYFNASHSASVYLPDQKKGFFSSLFKGKGNKQAEETGKEFGIQVKTGGKRSEGEERILSLLGFLGTPSDAYVIANPTRNLDALKSRDFLKGLKGFAEKHDCVIILITEDEHVRDSVQADMTVEYKKNE